MAYSIAYTRSQSRGYPKVISYNYGGGDNANTTLDTLLEIKTTMATGGLANIAGYRAAVKEGFDYIRQCEQYMHDSRPVLWCGLVASQLSCNTQHDPSKVGEEFFEDLNGAYQMMLDLKLPVEFVSGRDIAGISAAGYAALVLSDVGYLTGEQVRGDPRVRAGRRRTGGYVQDRPDRRGRA